MQYSISMLPVFPESNIFTGNSFQNLVMNEEIQIDPKPIQEVPIKSTKKIIKYETLSPHTIESYELKPNLLNGSKIEEFHRAQIRLWIAESCHTRGIHFRTATLASSILDFYFSKDNSCTTANLHEYGICCLRIANKLEDNFPLPVNSSAFSREKLVEIEGKICFKINFQLNPLTSTDIINSLTNLWAEFRREIQLNELSSECKVYKKLKYDDKAKIVQLEYSFILLHELLEFLQLVLNSFSYQLDVLAFNAFYLVLCLQFFDHRSILSTSEILRFTRKSKEIKRILECFVKFCNDCNYLLNMEVIEECQSFIYPLYNDLVSEGNQVQTKKDNQFQFNPNDPILRIQGNNNPQSLRFKNKKASFKKYMKRQALQKFRKCSGATHQ